MSQKKAMKKAFKKAKRKFIQPWKALSFLTSILLVIALLVGVIVNKADNTMAIITGDTYWELENEDESAVYYEGDYATGPFETGVQRLCTHSNLKYIGMYSVRDEDNIASFQTEEAIEGARAFARKVIEIEVI